MMKLLNIQMNNYFSWKIKIERVDRKNRMKILNKMQFNGELIC